MPGQSADEPEPLLDEPVDDELLDELLDEPLLVELLDEPLLDVPLLEEPLLDDDEALEVALLEPRASVL